MGVSKGEKDELEVAVSYRYIMKIIILTNPKLKLSLGVFIFNSSNHPPPTRHPPTHPTGQVRITGLN